MVAQPASPTTRRMRQATRRMDGWYGTSPARSGQKNHTPPMGARHTAATTHGGGLLQCAARYPCLRQQLSQVRPDVLRDAALAFGVGMDPVREIEPRLAGDAFQQERDQRHLRPSREVGEDLLELLRVVDAVVRR